LRADRVLGGGGYAASVATVGAMVTPAPAVSWTGFDLSSMRPPAVE